MRLLRCTSTSTSARLAPLADKLLASLAQFTHSMLLVQNHTETVAICPSLALLTHSALSGDPTPLAQNHMHTERSHQPVAHVARSFSALGRLRLFHSHRIWISYTHTDTVEVPPCSRSGCHLVARQPWPTPTIHQSISQNRPQTAEI